MDYKICKYCKNHGYQGGYYCKLDSSEVEEDGYCGSWKDEDEEE